MGSVIKPSGWWLVASGLEERGRGPRYEGRVTTGKAFTRPAAHVPRPPLAVAGIHDASRRRALGALAAGACFLITRPAIATPDELSAALRETFGDRTIKKGKVKLELPRLAENGNVVPALVTVESPMTEQDYVRAIHIFSEKNPLPRILEMRLGPHNGRASVSARIRMAGTQQVLAVAEMNDGSLWSAAVDIDVTVSSCT